MPKITFSHNFLWVNFRRNFTFLLGLCLSIFIFNLNAAAVYAVQTPTLSVSVDNAAMNVNGNQVINSVNGTTELPLNLTINTTNKTGYTATLNTETNETALVNSGSASGAKIDSITGASSILSLPVNTWGFKTSSETNYNPIPSLATPTNIFQTTEKTNGNDVRGLNIGMKLGQNIESGSYDNKLIFSVVTNPYEKEAVMMEGPEFIRRMYWVNRNQLFGVWPDFISDKEKTKAFKRSNVAYSEIPSNALNIEDSELSDYEIKAWFNEANGAVYYWAPIDRIYLNSNSSRMFMNFTKLTELDLSGFNTERVTNMSEMFRGVKELTSLDLSNFNTQNVTNMSGMFSGMSKVTNLNLSSFNTQNVTDMSKMFSYVENIPSIDLLQFNTKNVINMNQMFKGMKNLISLDVSSFNTSKVTNMSEMFSVMFKINVIDLSHFDTSRVTNMSEMFSWNNMNSLNISNFDTSNVTNMRYMFCKVANLVTLNISNFNTEKVTDMNRMFYEMLNLVTLDISNFNTKNVTDFSNIFGLDYDSRGSDKLEKIYVNNDFDTSNLTDSSDMFAYRYKLRGGNGSYLAYPSNADKTWLRVDRPGAQGYFTRKS